MTSQPFIAIEPSGETDQFTFRVEHHHCVGPEGREFLFGGASMGAGVAALEAACGRDLVWGSAQYVGLAHPGDTVRLAVSKLREGKGITVAELEASTPAGPVCRISAALGSGREEGEAQWRTASDVPPPESIERSRHWRFSSGLHSNMDMRVAHGHFGKDRIGNPAPDGRMVFWIRPDGDYRIDKAYLATIADFVPAGIGNALGSHSGGRSLDNTFRCHDFVATDWVLAEVSIHAIRNGLVHGNIALFAQDGTLLALGSQSLVLVHHV